MTLAAVLVAGVIALRIYLIARHSTRRTTVDAWWRRPPS